MVGSTLVGAALTGIIGSADGPTSVLFSGGVPTGYIIAAVVVVIAAIVLIRRARQTDGDAPEAAAAPAPAPVEAVVSADEELVAVLTAAILALEGPEGGQRLVIRSIRCIGTEGSPWAAAGRRDLMSQRNGRNRS